MKVLTNNRLAAGYNDGHIHLWNISSRRIITIWHAHDSRVDHLEFLLKINRLVSASGRIMRLWDSSTGKFIKEFQPGSFGLSDNKFELTCMRALPGGGLAIGFHVWREEISILNSSLDYVRTLRGSSSYKWTRGLKSLIILDHAYLVSCSIDWTITVWRYQLLDSKRGHIRRYKGHSGQVLCLAALSGGFMFASGGEDSKIKIWHRENGLKRTIETPYKVYSLAVLRDDSLVSGEQHGIIRIWNPFTGKLLKTISEASDLTRTHLAVLNDGRLVSAAATSEIRILKIKQTWIPSERFSYLNSCKFE